MWEIVVDMSSRTSQVDILSLSRDLFLGSLGTRTMCCILSGGTRISCQACLTSSLHPSVLGE